MQTIPQLLATLNRITEPAPGNTPDTAVCGLIALYKETASYITAFQELQTKIKAELTEVMVETGQLEYKTEAGRAYVPAPGRSVSYDAKALDVLAQANADLAELLRPYRKETERAGSLTIR